MPRWTAISNRSESPSRTPSEDEILESSQEMRDELISPPPTVPKKRKPTSAKPPFAVGHSGSVNKRPKLGTERQGTTKTAPGILDRSDLPASAHAKSLGRPLSGMPAAARAERRPSRTRPGPRPAVTPDSPSQTHVVKKSTGLSKMPKPARPRMSTQAIEAEPHFATPSAPSKSSNSTIGTKTTVRKVLVSQEKASSSTDLPQQALRPASKNKERRKTFPFANQEATDIDLTMGDDDPLLIKSAKPAIGAVLGPRRIAEKKYVSQGKVDNPIVLSDSDEDVSHPAPIRSTQPPEVIELDDSDPDQPLQQEREASPDEFAIRESLPPISPKPASGPRSSTAALPGNQDLQTAAKEIFEPVTSTPEPAEADRESEPASVGIIVPALDNMAISPPKQPRAHASLVRGGEGSASPSRPSSSAADMNMFAAWKNRDGSMSGTISRSSTSQTQDPEPLLGLTSDAMDVDLPAPVPPDATQSPTASKSSATPVRSPQPTAQGASPTGGLYSGRSGFFKSVHDRRDERRNSGVPSPSQSHSSFSAQPVSPSLAERPQPALTQFSASSSTPVLLSQASRSTPVSSRDSSKIPSPDAGASSGHELPPSSAEVSKAGSVQPRQASQARSDSMSLAPPVPRAGSNAEQDRPSAAPASALPLVKTEKNPLTQSLNQASFKIAEAKGDVIDLTLSDDEDQAQPHIIDGDPEVTIPATIELIGQALPALFSEGPSSAVPKLAAPAPVRAIGPLVPRSPAVPNLGSIRAIANGRRASGASVPSPSSRNASGGSVPPGTSPLDAPATKPQSPCSSSSEEPLARGNRKASVMSSGSTSDAMAVDEANEDAPKPVRRRGRPRKSRIVTSPGFGDDSDANDSLEAARLLMEDEGSDAANEESDHIVNRLRPRRQRGVATPASRASSSSMARTGRAPLRRNAATEDAIVPAMDRVHIEDDSDVDDPYAMVITWEKNGRQRALEYADVNLRACDLPFNLQNRMMSLPIEVRRADGLQKKIFVSMISAGTVDDEPTAPDIHIINDVDDELSPAFEFHYTNKMYHGKDVPGPDVYGLEGCNCIGRCDPTSTTCPCVKRQMFYMSKAVEGVFGQGFAYGLDGRIRTEHAEFPIIECNAACRCDDDECQNRVVQKGRKVKINIKKTVNKGWGVFAGQSIKKHTFLGVYAGEYLTNTDGDVRGKMYDQFGRTYLFDIDCWHVQQPPIFMGNKDDWSPMYCVDAFHVGNFTRFLNHSCDPNCIIVPVYINEANLNKPLLTIWTNQSVEYDEELCFSYVGDTEDLKPLTKKERRSLEARNAICRCGTRKCKGRLWLIEPESSSRGSSED
ncbi:SET domain-containing protein [Phanerochaete sordida]|uniref:SET domain-containing protein n=1 Tax=Phanerochaete sordida TaxID=48140 RepID=A0A9P3GI19_9APHY|nr:SET domain-containing protein [Phanerochaete sordida]